MSYFIATFNGLMFIISHFLLIVSLTFDTLTKQNLVCHCIVLKDGGVGGDDEILFALVGHPPRIAQHSSRPNLFMIIQPTR